MTNLLRRGVAALAVLALLALATTGLAGGATAMTPPSAGHVYSGSSNGKTVHLAHGARLFVALQAPSGTAYRWVVVKGKNTPKFAILERRTIATNPGVPGAPVRTVWTIKGKQPGTATFQVVLRSVVDHDVARRFTLHIKVTR